MFASRHRNIGSPHPQSNLAKVSAGSRRAAFSEGGLLAGGRMDRSDNKTPIFLSSTNYAGGTALGLHQTKKRLLTRTAIAWPIAKFLRIYVVAPRVRIVGRFHFLPHLSAPSASSPHSDPAARPKIRPRIPVKAAGG